MIVVIRVHRRQDGYRAHFPLETSDTTERDVQVTPWFELQGVLGGTRGYPPIVEG